MNAVLRHHAAVELGPLFLFCLEYIYSGVHIYIYIFQCSWLLEARAARIAHTQHTNPKNTKERAKKTTKPDLGCCLSKKWSLETSIARGAVLIVMHRNENVPRRKSVLCLFLLKNTNSSLSTPEECILPIPLANARRKPIPRKKSLLSRNNQVTATNQKAVCTATKIPKHSHR